ncbi:hypothetical protein LAUMK35_03415 [Mycobacterium pseudokansasii]|nr:hypothetical protein LAUMK35_03415 [Mycobacterium pseudokansasii]VAZ98074.1 hypothetical protein LAUMK21_03412 [Mycobacterium pseudokansasii]
MSDTAIPNITTSDHARADLAVLPVGSFEQYGPYLPLGTDTLVAVLRLTSE